MYICVRCDSSRSGGYGVMFLYYNDSESYFSSSSNSPLPARHCSGLNKLLLRSLFENPRDLPN